MNETKQTEESNPEEQPPEKPVSRQYKWQRARLAEGNCVKCGRPQHPFSELHCLECGIKATRPLGRPKKKEGRPSLAQMADEYGVARTEAPEVLVSLEEALEAAAAKVALIRQHVKALSRLKRVN